MICFLFLLSPSIALAKTKVDINIPSRSLTVYDDTNLVKQYPIAVGRPGYNSILGHYHVISKLIDPIWYPKDAPKVLPGPDNPLGIRWIGFYGDYGIHGNNNPKSIGTFASKGCFRMYNYDVEELFELVKVGDEVDIHYSTIHDYDNTDKSKAAVIVYTDLYNKKVNTYENVTQRLVSLGIKDRIPEAKLKVLYNKVNKGTVIFTKNWSLFVNGHYISADTIIKGNEDSTTFTERPNSEVLVNMYHVNTYFGLDLKINHKGQLWYNNLPIYYEIHNDIPYISVIDAICAIEGYYVIDKDQEKIDWIIPYGSLNGRYFKLDIKTRQYYVYLSLRDIVNALECDSFWDEIKRALIVGNKEIKGVMIGERMYITPKQVKEFFGLDSKYYSIQNRLELIQNNIKNEQLLQQEEF